MGFWRGKEKPLAVFKELYDNIVLKDSNVVLYTEKSVKRIDFMLSILATKKEPPKLYMDYKIYVF